MSDIRTALYYHIQTTSGIGAGISSRVYVAGDVPQDTAMPFLTIQQISNEIVRDQDGVSYLERTLFQITAVGATEKEAHDLAHLVQVALDAYRDTMGEAGATVAVRYISLDNELHIPLPPTDASQRGMHEYAQDYSIWNVTS